MKLLPSAIALGAGLLLAGAAFSASLTEADIERMLNQIDQAAQNHDAEGVGRHLAPQVKITIDMSAVAPQMPRVQPMPAQRPFSSGELGHVPRQMERPAMPQREQRAMPMRDSGALAPREPRERRGMMEP